MKIATLFYTFINHTIVVKNWLTVFGININTMKTMFLFKLLNQKYTSKQREVKAVNWRHRLHRITDRTLDVVFLKIYKYFVQDRERICSTRNSFGLLPQGYCEQNFWNDDINILSIILINLCLYMLYAYLVLSSVAF